MRAVTMREAKATLNELVEAAVRGEQVVLMRGSKHIAAIVPLSAEDLEVSARLSDQQAERLWSQLAAERRAGDLLEFANPAAAIAHLEARPARKRRVSSSKRSRPS